MRRRDFISAIAGAAAWPLEAHAQQSGLAVIGYLNGASEKQEPERAKAFRHCLSEAGYDAGRNASIEYGWAETHLDRLPALATELVRREVTAMVAGYNLAAALAAKAATATIPIVFMAGVDPVEAGLVASLNRAGGNLAGLPNLSNQVVPKHLEILRELAPAAKIIGLLVNPTNPPSETLAQGAQTAAAALGGVFIDKILKGARPGDLPVGQATKFITAVNLRTARVIDLTIPTWMLLRGDEVIE